jgi:AcrR family transcriptional regulator
MSPRPDVSAERKKQILDAAMIVFSHKGFHQARMDDIVKQSGLSKGTIYWYFNSKDEIISQILDNLFERELASLGELQNEEGSASERLLEFMRISLTDLMPMLKHMPLTYEFYAFALREETVRITLKKYFRSYVELLIPIIQQGIDSGEFRAINAREAAIAAGATFEGTILLWVYDPETVDLDRCMETGFRLFLNGLKA